MKRLRIFSLLIVTVLLTAAAAGCAGSREPSLYRPDGQTLDTASMDPSSTAEKQTEDETEESTEKATQTEEETTEPTTEAPVTEEPVTEEVGQPLEVGAKWYVNTDALNIRSAPSTESEVIGTLYRGEQILILAIEGEWLQIFSSAGNGYVHGDYVVSTYRETGLSGNPPADVPDDGSAETTGDNAQATPAGNGHIVCIDAGHQQAGISETEPNGPGSSVMKAKLTTGTQGCVTGIPEHQLNLTIALGLKQELLNRGYQVVMIRETADCPQSNAERAQVANASGAEIFVRIHANSSNNADVSGVMTYAPSPANPYMNADLINASNTLSNVMLNTFSQTTGAVNRGLLQDDSMTGINWCSIPVTIIEMGFMSNPTEDQRMADPSYQALMVQGIANGIDAYFGR